MAIILKCLLLGSFFFMQLISSAISRKEDDIAFEETTPPVGKGMSLSSIVPVRRLWGIPDTQTVVGKLFTLQIPKDAFTGDINHYEIVNKMDRKHGWPKWLDLESKTGTLKGVPFSSDEGIYYLTVRAVAPQAIYKSKDVFSLEVLRPELDPAFVHDASNKKACAKGSDPIMLTILMDADMGGIEPKRRVVTIENVAGYFGLHQDMFYLHEERAAQDLWSFTESFFMAGAGNVNQTKRLQFASVSLQIGCGRKMDSEYKTLVERIRREARDGTLAEVLMQPIVGWHAKNEFPTYFRDRRQVGSGDHYEDDEEDEDDYNESVTTVPTPHPPGPQHPHRHHHGEEVEVFNNTALFPSEVQYQLPSTSLLINYDDLISTPIFTPVRPTFFSENTISIEPTRVIDQDFITFTTSTTPTNQFPEEKTEEKHVPEISVPISSADDVNVTETTSDVTSSSSSSFSSSSSGSTSLGSTDQASTDYLTTDSFKLVNLTSGSSTVTFGTTEEMEPRNFRPTIAHRLKKVAVTAGKVLRFKIPDNTFADIEDGSTRHMTLSFKSQEGKTISPTSWIKFDSITQEILAVPLEGHVSKWEFEVEATDRDGDSVSDIFELQIQHHKGHRAVNFEFSAHLTVSSNWSSSVDWEIKMVDALVALYGDDGSSHITVRSVSQTAPSATFTWTNDTLPRSYCPRQDIDNLLKVIADEDGDVTKALQDILGPEIVVKKVTYLGIGQCESKPEPPLPPPQTPHQNYSPMPRNQIDQVNATAGRLLVYKVPEDTFYDPEDGNTRQLKISLLNMDRSPLPSNHWLQFDTKNQEFFGVPMDSDVRSQEYQLVCEDREGLTANDGLIVVVFPRPKRTYTVEFSIAVDVPYESFVNSSALKRKFLDKLAEVFGDSNTDSIVLGTITSGSTVITWHNHTLRTDECHADDIQRLREIIINDDASMSERLVEIMGHEFPVISVGLQPAGLCQGEATVHHKPDTPPTPFEEDSHPIGAAEDYLITFVIPAVVIALMLILSGIVACLFYRKRRASKMGIGDEDEKQSFRNKGIPVIFQDELEDKPEPENKCPVIMKEEKPPLPPPEYQRSQYSTSNQDLNEDTPYQPPPPFTSSRDTGRNTRPKPTPTYRKPPPYVPP